MIQAVRDLTVDWLYEMQGQGFFDGFNEETIDFKILDDEEIEWYFINWFRADGIEDTDDEDIIKQFKISTGEEI